MIYRYKAVWSGNVVEIYEYELGVKVGEPRKSKGKGTGPPAPEDRKKALRRARREVIRLANANAGRHGNMDCFLTLTFAENITDLKLANYEFKKFRQRLEYELQLKLKYICVVEFQRRGAIHYHVLLFGLPYVPWQKLLKIWTRNIRGSCWISAVHDIADVDNVGAYLVKYMTKNLDDERLRGQKSYFCSRGLLKPVETVLDEKEIDRLRAGLSHCKVYENEYANKYVGKVRYQQYNLLRGNVRHDDEQSGASVRRACYAKSGYR